MSRFVRRFVSRGAVVAAIWAALNGVLAALTFVFNSHSAVQQRAFYWAAVAIVAVLSALLLWLPRGRARSAAVPAGGGRSANGAPATAFAAACFIGGMAWVFGVFVAYLAVPLLAFVAARWRVEWAERKEGSP
jgi:hypothetical protein